MRASDGSVWCTVVVPSYRRLNCVLELLERLRRQDHESFEVLVVEQTPDPAPEHVAALEALCAEDPRIRVERHPPLGVGGARNVGIRSGRGEIVLIIDDDDLPAGDDWITQHSKNYEDDDCIAVHGREVLEGATGACFEDRFPWLAYKLCLSYTPFGTSISLPGNRRRKQGCAWLRGGNSSIRRQWALDAGGWIDECGIGHEEHDFSYRLKQRMSTEQYILFDPAALMIRRMDVPGGADRRSGRVGPEVEGQVRFYLGVVRRHHPVRTALLLPLYPGVILWRGVMWILDDRRHEPLHRRLLALVHLVATFPWHFARGVAKLGKPVRPSTAAPSS